MEVFMKKMRISKENKKIGDKKVPFLIGDESGKGHALYLISHFANSAVKNQELHKANRLPDGDGENQPGSQYGKSCLSGNPGNK
jgi:hypothetical protein